MKSGELKRAKRRIRRQVLAARDALTPDQRTVRGERVAQRFLALPEARGARSVMLFWSFGSEVPTAVLIDRLHARGVTVALPRISGDRLVPVTYAPGDPTRSTAFGTREPTDGTELDAGSIDVVAVPGVAFDTRCGRIGYGGGYYDRFLRGLPAFTVGLAFGLQILEEAVPGGRSDLPLDAIVTEAETIRRST